MSTPAIVAEAQRLQALGYTPVPCRSKWVPEGDNAERVYTPEEFTGWERARVRTGVAVNGGPRPGWVLVRVDLDKHHDFQNPAARLAEIRNALPTAEAARLIALPSTNGAGLDVLFFSPIAYASQDIYDPQGRVAGELICVGGVQLAPAPPEGVEIPALGKETRDRLMGALHFAPNAGPSLTPGNSDRKKDIAEGLALAAGWEKERQNIPEWRTFLQRLSPLCKPAQQKAAADLLREYATTSDRSVWFADFIQHAMLRGYELGAGYQERCRRVMALAYSTRAAGKGTEHELIKDAAALIARIARGARKAGGGTFVQPYWCKARPSGSDAAGDVSTIVEVRAPARRPAHRPPGSRDRGVAKLARELARRAEDAPGRLYYYAHDLAEAIGVADRTVQDYLARLVNEQLVTRGQEGGRGGRGWLELQAAFWGANKYLRASAASLKTAPQTQAPGVQAESHSTAPPRGETASGLQCIRSIRIHRVPPSPAEAPPNASTAIAGELGDIAARDAEAPVLTPDAGAQRPAGAQVRSDAPSDEPTRGRPTLAEAVAAAFDAIPRLYADAATGLLGKVTLKRVRAELERQGHAFNAAQTAAAYANEQKRRKPKPWEAAQAEARAIVDDDELRTAAAKAAARYEQLRREASLRFVAEKVAKAEEYNQLDAAVSGRKGGRRQPKDLEDVRASAQETHKKARRRVHNARWRAEALAAEVARRTPATQIVAEDAQIAAQVAWAQQRAIDGPRERAEAVANHYRLERQDVAAVARFTTFTTAAQPPAPLEGDGTPNDAPQPCHGAANDAPRVVRYGYIEPTPAERAQWAADAERSRTMAERMRERLAEGARHAC